MFFFKQKTAYEFCFFMEKTAYEIGLGIPAEPLFRSCSSANISNRRISGMALLILALLQRIFLMSSLMLLLVWLIFFMVLIKLLPILGTISGKAVKLMVLGLICLGNNRQDCPPPNCLFSCLQILEGFLWFGLISLLNGPVISLILRGSMLLNLLVRLV